MLRIYTPMLITFIKNKNYMQIECFDLITLSVRIKKKYS